MKSGDLAIVIDEYRINHRLGDIICIIDVVISDKTGNVYKVLSQQNGIVKIHDDFIKKFQ